MINLATLAQELDTYSAAVRQRFLHIIPSPTVTYCHILPNHPTQHYLNGGLWQQGSRQDALSAINLRYICNIFAVCSWSANVCQISIFYPFIPREACGNEVADKMIADFLEKSLKALGTSDTGTPIKTRSGLIKSRIPQSLRNFWHRKPIKTMQEKSPEALEFTFGY